MRRLWSPVLIGLALFASLLGCSEEPPEVKAWSRVVATAQGLPWTPEQTLRAFDEAAPIFSDDFESTEAWIIRGKDFELSDSDAFSSDHCLRFPKRPSFALTHLELDSDTAFFFSARTRGKPLGSAKLLLHDVEIPSEIRSNFRDLVKHARRVIPAEVVEAGSTWTRIGKYLETGESDRWLTLVLSADEAAADASGVDFDLVRLTRAGPAGAFVNRKIGDDPYDLRVKLGEREDRWCRFLSPGHQISVDVTIPKADPRLQMGLSYLAGSGAEIDQPVTLVLEFDDGDSVHPIQEIDIAPARGLASASYRDVSIALGPWAGKSGTLKWTAALKDGQSDPDGAVLLGAPQLLGRWGDDPRPPNVIMISLDTLRADRTGPYGYSRPTSPVLDRFATRGVVVDQAYSTSAYTNPSHASMLTGQYPRTHGVIAGDVPLQPPVSPTLARTLADAGYVTVAATGGGFVDPVFGFAEGFDVYTTEDPFCIDKTPDPSAPELATLLERMNGYRDVPYFLFLHTYGAHDYVPMPEDLAPFRDEELGVDPAELRDRLRLDAVNDYKIVTPEDVAILSELYDATIRGTDRVLGYFFDSMEQMGLMDNTLIVITSDHGEEFFEHGALFHRHSLYEEMIRVPMLFAGPGVPEGARIEGPMSLVDVVPTLLGFLGRPIDERIEGHDFSAAMRDQEPPSEAAFAELQWTRHQIASLVAGSRKLITWYDEATGEPVKHSLYDLAKDPGELNDLAPSSPQLIEPMSRELQRMRDEQDSLRSIFLGDTTVDPSNLGAALAEKLKALGYIDQ